MFGRLSGVVRPCRWAPRLVRASLIGGPGAGKTYGAIGMASGMRSGDGVIVLISAGENRAEEMYSGLAEFHHVDCVDVAQVAGFRDPCTEGTDPRVADIAIREVANNVPPGSVVIFDSVSDVWDGAKSHIDRITGGNDRKNRQAWATVTPWWANFWHAVESCRSHVLLTVRAKTVSDQEKGPGGRMLTVQIPTDQENRNRDQFRTDCRIYIDSFHRVWCEGRLSGINDDPPRELNPGFGARMVAYCATGKDPGTGAVDVDALPVPSERVARISQRERGRNPAGVDDARRTGSADLERSRQNLADAEDYARRPAPAQRQPAPTPAPEPEPAREADTGPMLPPYGAKVPMRGEAFAAACVSVDVKPGALADWYIEAGGGGDLRGKGNDDAFRRAGVAAMLRWSDLREAVQRGIPASDLADVLELPDGDTAWARIKAEAGRRLGGES